MIDIIFLLNNDQNRRYYDALNRSIVVINGVHYMELFEGTLNNLRITYVAI